MSMKRKHDEHFHKKKKLCFSDATDEHDNHCPEDNIDLGN